MTPAPPDLSRLFDSRRPHAGAPDDAVLRHAASAGDLARIRRSIYREVLPPLSSLPSDERWAEERRRFLELAIAVGLTRTAPVVFAGETALAVLGFPALGATPQKVELLEPLDSTRRGAFGIIVHRDAFRPEDVEPWGEFFVTSPARTLADLAKWTPRAKAVAALDFAFNAERAGIGMRATRPEVEAALDSSLALHHRRSAELAIAFADPLSGSVGESVSRVLIDDFGFPAPCLQLRHPAPPGLGRWFFTDFEWPELGLIGEFDGRTKYAKEGLLDGRTPTDVVIAEKRREDALRAAGFRVVRWTWEHLRSPMLLRSLLVDAGLRPTRATRTLIRPW